MKNFDVAFIGNGILSLSSALSLLKRNPTLKIAIVGPQARKGGASLAAGAMLNCYAEVTPQTLCSKAGLAKLRMAQEAMSIWPDWLADINTQLSDSQQIQMQKGTFVLSNTKSGPLDCLSFQAILQSLQQFHASYEEVDPKVIQGLKPKPNERPLRALYLPEEGCIDTELLMSAIQKILARHENVFLLDDEVTALKTDGSKVDSIQTKKAGQVTAHQYVLAAGVFSQALLDQIPALCNSIPRIFAGVGYALQVEQAYENPVNHVIRTPNRAGACGLHVLPKQSGGLYIGASNTVLQQPSMSPSAGYVNFLLQCAFDQINEELHHSSFQRTFVGNRPVTMDSFPILGKTSCEKLWILSGTYRDGFHQSPVIAECLADELLEGQDRFTKLFRPERPLLTTMTREETVQEYVLHHLSSFYEHGSKIPYFMSDAGFEKVLQLKVERIYEDLEIEHAIAPDMLFFVDFEVDRAAAVKALKSYFKNYKPQISMP